MTQDDGLSLTEYLIELSHDYAKLKAFWEKEPSTRGNNVGLTTEAQEALNTGDLETIRAQLAAENAPPPEEGTTAAASSAPSLIVLSPLRPIN